MRTESTDIHPAGSLLDHLRHVCAFLHSADEELLAELRRRDPAGASTPSKAAGA